MYPDRKPGRTLIYLSSNNIMVA